MKDLAPRALVDLSVTQGSSTPAPASGNPIAFSSGDGAVFFWNGSVWVRNLHYYDVVTNVVQPGLVSGSNIKTVNGQSLLGSGDLAISGGGYTPVIAKLTSTQASTATALADVTQLVGALVANGVYEVTCFVTFQSAATTTGLNLGFTSPTGTVCHLEVVVPVTSTAATNQLRTIFPSAAATNTGDVRGTGVTAVNSNHTARIMGVLHVGATAGNFQVRFASEISGSAVTLQVGSALVLKRIA